MRKLFLILLLPFLMLLAQQGAVRHELVHLTESSQSEHQKQHPGDTLCDTCLSFAHIAASAAPDMPPQWLPAQLKHHLVATVWSHVTELVALAAHSRGPPDIF